MWELASVDTETHALINATANKLLSIAMGASVATPTFFGIHHQVARLLSDDGKVERHHAPPALLVPQRPLSNRPLNERAREPTLYTI